MICPICKGEKITNLVCETCSYTFLFNSNKSNNLNKTSDLLLNVDNFLSFFNRLNNQDEFLSKKTYESLLVSNEKHYNTVLSLIETNMIETYCRDNNYSVNNLKRYIDYHKNFENYVSKHNDRWLKSMLLREQKYLDEILGEVDKNIKLDEEQRIAVLSDEDYSLIIAGAGSGKTTTMAAKVKYLVDKKNIDPKEILVISYTNKAVKELKERINEYLGIPTPISTFHSVGNAIIRRSSHEFSNVIGDNGFKFNIIRDYISKEIKKDPQTLNKLIMFFGVYIEIPADSINDLNLYLKMKSEQSYQTMRSKIEVFVKEFTSQRSKQKITINKELLRSQQEVEIANFFYLHSLEYEYEKIFKYNIEGSKKLYTPDFYIKQGSNEVYLEHFGVSESGENSKYSNEELLIYLKSIEDKKEIHKKYATKLITTYSSYNDGRDLITHLEEELKKAGFILFRKDAFEVHEKIVHSENENYINRFCILATRFIQSFKTNGFTDKDFTRMRASVENVRTHIFLDLIEKSYYHYQNTLKERQSVDFEDMINESTRILDTVKKSHNLPKFKYVLIDEYQDISHQRFDLAKVLADVTSAKIVAVGDDWQSIFAFAGSDISLFVDFQKLMGYADILKISNTYRNSQELIDIAGSFIQKNSIQINKRLISSKKEEKPIFIYTYSEVDKESKLSGFSKIRDIKAKKINDIISELVEKYGKEKNILLLGRYNFDGEQLADTKYFTKGKSADQLICLEHPKVKLNFLTAHSSKGLSADNVVIINAIHSTYGFPSQIEDDPIFKLVINTDKSIEYAEERRLFYVALTRTKNRVYIIAPENKPSQFVLELIKDYPNIVLSGNIVKSVDPLSLIEHKCPRCNYPLRFLKNPNYKLALYICTNEPEICDYMTNEPKSKGNIHRCEKCDGFMIVKTTKDNNGFIFGCTNYNFGTGCNNIQRIDSYIDKGPELYSKKIPSKIIVKPILTADELKMLLIEFRKTYSKSKNLPAYMVFDNKTLDKIIKLRPKQIDDLSQIDTLSKESIKFVGRQIIDILNK